MCAIERTHTDVTRLSLKVFNKCLVAQFSLRSWLLFNYPLP